MVERAFLSSLFCGALIFLVEAVEIVCAKTFSRTGRFSAKSKIEKVPPKIVVLGPWDFIHII